MSTQRHLITVKGQECEITVLFAVNDEAINKRQAREEIAFILENIAIGARTDRKRNADNGRSGFGAA